MLTSDSTDIMYPEDMSEKRRAVIRSLVGLAAALDSSAQVFGTERCFFFFFFWTMQLVPINGYLLASECST